MTKARRMTKAAGMARASALGKRVAAQVVDLRVANRRKRQVARPRRRRAVRPAGPDIPLRTRRALAALPPATGILVAEGDSWFDYPFNDVLSMLEDEHGFDIESVSHKGDTVEDMAYS